MAAFIQVGNIQNAAMTNAVGQFFGQNIQNGWDSHSTMMMSAGFCMGDWSYLSTLGATLTSRSQLLMPIFDQDQKCLYSPITQR
ncbi:hypothetical protein [Sulfoacidibacillus thermotolerans]|uniref:Uncharacterized protein n=1 Tax=Sulfoacidibacillus thermotolerans TaxID=1765684 RepID=A0A2U3DCF0_SULT2|nr:hypothetical protein [Sulfoacidibacillus thermotolerans]PWI58961.1 hypothetical protein BM613_02500 [Sulfoacidibacillus thermotolerans]